MARTGTAPKKIYREREGEGVWGVFGVFGVFVARLLSVGARRHGARLAAEALRSRVRGPTVNNRMSSSSGSSMDNSSATNEAVQNGTRRLLSLSVLSMLVHERSDAGLHSSKRLSSSGGARRCSDC